MLDASPTATRIPWLVFGLALAAAWLPTPASAGDGLTIQIVNIRHEDAPLRLQILRGEDAFRRGEPSVAAMVVPASADGVRLSLDSLRGGEYAIRVVQDLNGNGALDTNAVGMPTEPWGMSNDAVGNFGPPSWDDAKFAVPGTGLQTITLR
jgi:uncharacterized protein (DUF2141 family)